MVYNSALCIKYVQIVYIFVFAQIYTSTTTTYIHNPLDILRKYKQNIYNKLLKTPYTRHLPSICTLNNVFFCFL